MTITLKPLLFDEAVRFFEEKGLRLSPESYLDVWAAEHVSAFTVARVTAVDILEDIRKAVTDAIQDGIPLNEFKAALSSILEAKGWFTPKGEDAEITLPDGTVRKRLTPWRLNTIYQTNLQSAYSTGRYSQMMGVAAERPFWMYDAVNDARTRPSHAAQDGKVYRFDHPFWNTWYPPNGYNCRCVVRTLSPAQMQRRGLSEWIEGPAETPDEGFAYNPGQEKWQPDFNKYSAEASAIIRKVMDQAGKLEG